VFFAHAPGVRCLGAPGRFPSCLRPARVAVAPPARRDKKGLSSLNTRPKVHLTDSLRRLSGVLHLNSVKSRLHVWKQDGQRKQRPRGHCNAPRRSRDQLQPLRQHAVGGSDCRAVCRKASQASARGGEVTREERLGAFSLRVLVDRSANTFTL